MTLSSLASRRARRLLVVPAALALSASALAACSDSGSTTTTSSSSAAASSGSASSSQTSEGAAKGDTVSGEKLVGRMQAALKEAGTYKMETPLGNGGESAVSEVVLKDGKASTHTNVNVAGMEVIALNNGEEVFLKSEDLGVSSWTKVESNSDNPAIAAMAQTIDAMRSSFDPMTSVELFKGSEFVNVGTEEIEGVSTTKWTGESSMSDILARLPQNTETATPSSSASTSSTDEVVPVEIYLDENDRPIKWVLTVGGQRAETVFSDYGSDITVEAPTVGS